MQKISEVMTRDVMTISPQETLERAAQMMDELNVGSLPVWDGTKLVGMITDRDITIRSTAAGQSPGDAFVRDVMSDQVRTCFDDQTVDEVLQQMSDVQIRRVPVLDRNTQNLVGIVALGDLAEDAEGDVQGTLRDISTPAQPDRPQLGS
ncbi:MAG TPA: CBS domain-containing protein [Noviherbaspirillum sp.]|jgi:CBS domain-containing protein|uniref:CBS domain-containing protein n=1 Tax=Noviherbaspirillum sp. TaxID=1926288 RepID=UPI002DDD64EA|nr:CBS domain-containing protein [Noviherbaspirillum sp.]HEV2612159.1 CBS domain-containing protein [Noviherbaspirillum sp.]